MVLYQHPQMDRSPDMSGAEVEKLVTILPPREETVTQQEAEEQVRQLIQDVCNKKNVDRSVEYPSFLMVHAPRSEACHDVVVVKRPYF
jgi:hypothetical protein